MQQLPSKNDVLTLTIDRLAFGGVGVGKLPTEQGDFTVFVENAIPGQTVKAKVQIRRKRYAECRLLEVIEKSKDEIEIPFQSIPGAPYATWPLELQHENKIAECLRMIEKTGGVNLAECQFDGLISGMSHWHYRNKMEYAFSAIGYDSNKQTDYDGFALGFKKRGTWWCVENLEKDSGLFDEPFENILPNIRRYCEATGLPAWHPPQRNGFFRYLTVRKSFSENQLLLNIVTSTTDEKFSLPAFAAFVQNLLGDRLAGLIHTVNGDTGDRVMPLEGESALISGKEFITENILGLEFRIGMTSFFQTNPSSAALLYERVVTYTENICDQNAYVLDLFCGTGTIGQLIAKHSASKVIGVDIVASAIEDARMNAKMNQVHNVEFICADVGLFLKQHPQYQERIGCIVMDPPRAGISPKTLMRVIAINSKALVYVSCNPSTFARDASTLQENGYILEKFSLVDQFPHTSHIEAIGLFLKQ
jgi:23S rRNA (uracil-5-)-methyltransferase RumA